MLFNAATHPAAAAHVDANIVAIVGLGYVGLPTALAYAGRGRGVIGIDTSEPRLRRIRTGEVDLLDGDRSRLARALSDPSFRLTADPTLLRCAGTVIVCVPTPVDEHMVPDLEPLKRACATVVRNASPGQTIVLTSTSYVGTTRELLIEPLANEGLDAGRDVFLAFSPERVDPGNGRFPQDAVPRVVGGATAECAERAARMIGAIAPHIHIVSSPEAAEMTKLYENTFRAINIAFANEMAGAASALGVRIDEVIDAAATKPYGFMRFTPGPGVGGHCIPCDPRYLQWQMQARRTPMPLLDRTMASIAERPAAIVTRIRDVLSDRGTGLRDARVLVAGVAYKPGVEDVRESPAGEIIASLRSRGAIVEYHDPMVPVFTDALGVKMRSVAVLQPETYDLILAHTIHPGFDAALLRSAPVLLDATYRLPGWPNRVLP